jgi:outer membrane receptor protein involved in Fe transport
MSPIRLLNVFLLVSFSFTLFAQKGIIQGYITDQQSRSPLGGVTISFPDNFIADNSDDFGMFCIKGVAPGRYELSVSHTGYATEKIPVNVVGNKIAVVKIDMERSNLSLSSVTVSTRKTSLLNTIAPLDIKLRPVNTSQDLLRVVSGLFIAQHAGGGKAEQIFLRGYDIDHGTDINISVDGLPVNMVSHAHGQGYADLHFLIPETVEKVNFDKGPYNTSKGNLATAGFVDFTTKDFLQSNQLKVQAGHFNTQRIFGMFKLLNRETPALRQQLYVASEYFRSNAYFENPQPFHRFNMMAKYNAIFNDKTQLTVLASTLGSKWDASGQIPQRAVTHGMISRFGAIDDNEGGNTNRTNLSAKLTSRKKNGWHTTQQLYFTNYRFNLYSNFTFFLNDPVNGDGIHQRETRSIYGYTGTLKKTHSIGNKNTTSTLGAGLRYDYINNIELNRVVNRNFFEHVQQGDIHEVNAFAWLDQQIELSNEFNANAGLRYDFFQFGYKDILAGEMSFKKQTRGVLNPKLNFNYIPNSTVKIFLNTGTGFHSNDARVILGNDANDILPKVFGVDLGVVLKPTNDLLIKTALWQLYSRQEFVYVGDEGIVEPGGKTRRSGIDASVRYQALNWLYADIDLNYAKPRAINKLKGENYVPLAPTFTSIGGLTVKTKNGFNTSLRYRYIGDRPANEDNSVRAKGYLLLDAVASYIWKKIEIAASVENLLNRKWNEAQFNTESRLQFESVPVSEIHFTPGTPRFFKASLAYNF